MEHELYLEAHLGNCHQIPASASPWEVFKTRQPLQETWERQRKTTSNQSTANDVKCSSLTSGAANSESVDGSVDVASLMVDSIFLAFVNTRIQSTPARELFPARGCTCSMLGNSVVGLCTCCGVDFLSYHCAFNITLCVTDYSRLQSYSRLVMTKVNPMQTYNSTNNYSCWCFTDSRLKFFNQKPHSPRA